MKPLPENILIIDDSRSEIDLIRHFLSESGYKTCYATNWKSTQQKLKSNRINLILLDVILENDNGYDILEKLRIDDDTKDIPIIFLTSKSDDNSIIHGLSAGARDYVIKPFKKQELLLRIKNVLEQDENEKRYSTITNYAPVGILVHINDEIQFANPQAASIVGEKSADSLIGKRLIDYVHPAQKNHFLDQRKILETKGYVGPFDLKILKENGNEIYLSAVGKKTIYMGHSATLAFFFDITEKKGIEQKLHEHYIFEKILMESIPSPIFFKDINLRYRGCNRAFEKFIGVSKKEIVGKTVFDISSRAQAKLYDKMDRELIQKKGIQVYESKVETKNGNSKEVIFNKAIYPNSDGNIGGLIGVIQDITDQRRREQELQQLLQKVEKSELLLKQLLDEKDKFFSIIAHDLKNPITGFLGLSKLISEGFYDLPLSKIQTFSNAIYNSVEVLHRLIENLLEWATIQRGLASVNPVNIKLSDAVSEILVLFNQKIEEKRIKITTSIPKKLVVKTDSNMFYSIIRNFLSNAIKFTPRDGKIRIETVVNRRTIRISVIDSGIGIEPDKIDQLFRINKRQSSKGTEGETGTGLGLILCKEFSKKLGGEITVKSKSGLGSAFSLILPRCEL